MYASTFVAQYIGARQPSRVGLVVWQTIWVGVAATPLFIWIGHMGGTFFDGFAHAPDLVQRETVYFRILNYVSGCMVINAGLTAFWIGRGATATVMLVEVIAALINIVLNYPCIFGLQWNGVTLCHEMGIQGAALATNIAIVFKTIWFGALFMKRSHRREFGTLSNCRFDGTLLLRILRFGLPSGFQLFLEGGAVTVFVLIVARIDEVTSAATALAFSVNMIVFIPVVGLSMAVTTLVGQQIGRGRPDLAARATINGLWIGTSYTLLFCLSYLAMPDLFLALHRLGSANIHEIRELAVALLAFVAIYCLFDTIQLIFVSAIKGAGDTAFVVVFTIISSTLFLVAGFFGASYFADSGQKVWWWWSSLTGWIVVLAIVYAWRFFQGKWRTMTVIESDLIDREIESGEGEVGGFDGIPGY
jgi:MATE family multidrug resistance protein